jgi:hypothetical protein
MEWRHPAFPPLLRGLGTSVLVSASLLVGIAEHRQGEAARAALERAQQRIEGEARAARAGQGIEALTREVSLLRRQLSETGLAGQVFANPFFQVLGALGTMLVAGSFFVEAAQRCGPASPRPPEGGPD